jgi:hypothetical protein
MPVKLNSSGGGSVTLTTPSTASDFTATFPAVTGDVVTTGSNAAVTPAMLSIGAPSWNSSGDLQFNSGYGSVATAYGCRAWVNFNGTGTVAIRASGNVTSITDNGTGEYTVNLTTALTDANYSAVGSCGTGTAGNDDLNLTSYFNTAPTTSALRVGTQRANSGVSTDVAYIAVAIFR